MSLQGKVKSQAERTERIEEEEEVVEKDQTSLLAHQLCACPVPIHLAVCMACYPFPHPYHAAGMLDWHCRTIYATWDEGLAGCGYDCLRFIAFINEESIWVVADRCCRRAEGM